MGISNCEAGATQSTGGVEEDDSELYLFSATPV